MDEVRDRARLVDASTFDGRGVTATVPRADIEGVLASVDGPPELVLDIERREGADVEAHTLRIEWDPKELEEVLRTASGDQVTLVLDREQLERAMQEDVEAHGLREKAALFAVAAVAGGGLGTGIASASTGPSIVTDGGGASGATPIAMVGDAASGGGYTAPAANPQLVADSALSGPVQQAQAASPELVADSALSGPVQQAQAESPQLVADSALSGPVQQAQAASPELVADSALSGPVQQAQAESPQLVADSALSGPVEQPMTPQQIVDAAAGPPQMVSDAASSGPVTQAAESSGGGGWDISAPDPTTTGIIAGGVALMVTAAGFVVRGQRRQVGHPA
jgi:hypothetical protein